jgi:hypothetical protein
MTQHEKKTVFIFRRKKNLPRKKNSFFFPTEDKNFPSEKKNFRRKKRFLCEDFYVSRFLSARSIAKIFRQKIKIFCRKIKIFRAGKKNCFSFPTEKNLPREKKKNSFFFSGGRFCFPSPLNCFFLTSPERYST